MLLQSHLIFLVFYVYVPITCSHRVKLALVVTICKHAISIVRRTLLLTLWVEVIFGIVLVNLRQFIPCCRLFMF